MNRQNFMLFTPMLPEVAAARSLRATSCSRCAPHFAAEAPRGLSRRSSWARRPGSDLARRTVTVRHPVTHESKLVEYDELVLAVGATDSTMGVPGVEKFARAAQDDCRRRRSCAAASSARWKWPPRRTTCWSAIGFCALSSLAEISRASNLRASCRRFLELDSALLSALSIASRSSSCPGVRRRAARPSAREVRQIRGGGLNRSAEHVLRLKQEVSAVDGRGVELKGGERIASATILWAAGEKPSPLAEPLGLKTNEHGAIETGGDFAVEGARARLGAGRLRGGPEARRRHLRAARAECDSRRRASG